MPLLPSGTITLLSAAIERATQYKPEQPDQWSDFCTVLQEAIEAHGGAIVRASEEAVYAVFATAPRALHAALAAFHMLLADPRSQPDPPPIRMALHTDTVYEHPGPYVAPPHSHVDQILSAAHPGQILLSEATSGLARRHLPVGVELHDTGVHRLADLTRAERIFHVVAPDLPYISEPLRTLDIRPNNLPTQPTPLIDREQDLEMARQRLLAPTTRLLTLTGTGGVGKTRLALHLAAHVLHEFADGAYVVPLASVSDPSLLIQDIAQTLGVSDAGNEPLPVRLQALLRSKHLLLILDNFEQLLPAALLVADLLAGCPRLKVLVTSRAVVGVYGEQIFPVAPLAVPNPGDEPNPGQLSQYAAVRLFLERAVAVKPTFHLTDANAVTVAEICRRLDGIPLAIELAATWIRVLPPQGILTQLSSRLQFLTGGAPTLPGRHQTLRASLDWSYSLLDAPDQTLFARLGVFAHGWTVDAAGTVCNAEGDLGKQVGHGLTSLLDKSLVQHLENEDEPRFVLLDTLREYAWEQLQLRGEATRLRAQHALYYLNLAETIEPELATAEQQAWLERLEADHDNLRAALQYLVDTGDMEQALRLASTLGRFWWIRGHLGEGRQWLERVLQATTKHTATPTTIVLRAKALYWVGILAIQQGAYQPAQTALAESLQLCKSHGDRPGIGLALNALGVLANRRGHTAEARERYEAALAIFRELHDQERIATLLNNLGFTFILEGQSERAKPLLVESLSLSRCLDDTAGIAFALSNLGLAAIHERNYDQAPHLLTESFTLFNLLGDKRSSAECLEALAEVAIVQGDVARAVRLLGAADRLRDLVGAPRASHEQGRHDRTMAAARAQLDAEVLATAWDEGHTMSPVQILTRAEGPVPTEAASGQPEMTQSTPRVPAEAAGIPTRLTAREVEVLRLVAEGLSDAQVAERLVLSPRTVHKHLTSIYAKLGVHSRSAATRYAIEHHLA